MIQTPNSLKTGFLFDCAMCGDCCTGDMRIQLNLFDLYKIGKFLNYKQSLELFNHKVVKLSKGENAAMLPYMHFKGKRLKFCPFLINDTKEDGQLYGLCGLHPQHKPLVCQLAPANRTVDLAADVIEYGFIEPTGHCPGMGVDCYNVMEEIVTKHTMELAYEYRFYRLLDVLIHCAWDEHKWLSGFYSFNLAVDFELIIKQFECEFLHGLAC